MFPSPNDQTHSVGVLLEESVNWTVNGTVPDVGVALKPATGVKGVVVVVVVTGVVVATVVAIVVTTVVGTVVATVVAGVVGAVVATVVVVTVGVVVVVVTVSAATGMKIPAVTMMTRKTGKKKSARGHGSPDLSGTCSG